MNNLKPSAVFLMTATLFLSGCRKEDNRQDSGDGLKSFKNDGDDRLKSRSEMPRKSVQQSNSSVLVKSSQQERQRVMDDIVGMIGKPDGGLTRAHWMKIEGRYWLSSFDRTIRGLDDTTPVHNLLSTPEGEVSLVGQLLSGSFETEDLAEVEALLAFHNMALITAATGGEALPFALASRQNDPNITQGDLIMFEVFNDAFQNVPRTEVLSSIALQEWKQLAESPNDLIRLLALRTFRKVTPQPEQWFEFYQLYVDEPTSEILIEVADKLFETAMLEASDPLAEIRARVDPSLSAELAAKLDRSIEFLSKLPAGTQ